MGLIRPSFLDNMSWEMAEVYGAVTDQILINLASYFPYWKSGNVPKSAFEYQANMLAQMGQVNADTIKIIKNGLKGANKTLAGCLEQAIIEAVKKAQPELLKGVKSGILKPAGIPIVAPTQMRAFQLYYQQAAQKLNLVNTVMLESTKQAYQATVSDIVNRVQATQTALDIGAGETVTGVSSWNQAVRHSIDRMKRDGITGFIDHGGHRWSAEAYTAMDIRTTVANTARSAVWETNQDFGNDLYLVSYHNGARPLCYPWQNKVISSTDNARIVTDLDGNEIPVWRQSDTSYGEPAGLFGINCKHYPSPFIPGVSLIRGEPQSPEENERTYEESQKQRALERKIREEKRDLLMMKAQGASEEEIKAQRAKIRQTDDDIDAFCDATGRARRQNREGVYTQRSFPDPDSYDPTTFEREQKETIEKYFSGGGAQTGYTFGQMDTGAQVLTTSGTVQAETPKPVERATQTTHNVTALDLPKEMQETLRDYTNGKYQGICDYSQYVVNGNSSESPSIFYSSKEVFEKDYLPGIDEQTKKDAVALLETIERQQVSSERLSRIEYGAFNGDVGGVVNLGIRSTSANPDFIPMLERGEVEGLPYDITGKANHGNWTEYRFVSSKNLDISELSKYTAQDERLVAGRYRVVNIETVEPVRGGLHTVRAKDYAENVTHFTSKSGKDMVRYTVDGKEMTDTVAKFETRMTDINMKPVWGRKIVTLEIEP